MKSLQLFFAIVLMVFLTACGSKSSKNSSTSESIIEDTYDATRQEGYRKGHIDGYCDGSQGIDYGVHCQEENDYQIVGEKEAYETGYGEGYKDGFKEGRNAYLQENSVTVTTTSTPNTYSDPNLNSGTLHSNEGIYGNYSNYEETDNCVEGVVVYEGGNDYYIVETRRGYTVLERRHGSLSEGNKVRGELNRYGTKYLINRNRDSEVKVYIEDYALSEDAAIEWMGENMHLKYEDQRNYDGE